MANQAPITNDIKTGLTLAISALVAVVIIVTVFLLTTETIQATKQATLSAQLTALLKTDSYDNDPATDFIFVDHKALSLQGAQPVYLARLESKLTGLVVSAIAPDGYSGAIHLLVGLTASGDVVGVRVTDHKETPGLGDDIDLRQSTWITSFDNIRQGELAQREWQVKKDGGRFDQFTGATITPRAVVRQVHRVVTWYEDNQHSLLSDTVKN